jgi:serine/threonine-protein kinase
MTRYEVGRRIKRGGMAEVFEARALGQAGFERRVVMKRMLPALASDGTKLDAFVDEARILSRLHHANIVAVLDYGDEGALPYQILEWVDGLDLADVGERLSAAGDRIDPGFALYVTLEVARALAYAHRARDNDGSEMGIVHRDISASNVLVSWAGDVKLADFGIAWAAERLVSTGIGITKGKLEYMSPEQLIGDHVDRRTDLFALGCLMHRLITGATPTEDEAVRRDLVTGKSPPLSPRLDADVAAIIRRATRPARSERYSDADEMALDLERALIGRTEIGPRAAAQAFMDRLRTKDDLESDKPDAVVLVGERSLPIVPSPIDEASTDGERQIVTEPSTGDTTAAERPPNTAIVTELLTPTAPPRPTPIRIPSTPAPRGPYLALTALVMLGLCATALLLARAPAEPSAAVLPVAAPSLEPPRQLPTETSSAPAIATAAEVPAEVARTAPEPRRRVEPPRRAPRDPAPRADQVEVALLRALKDRGFTVRTMELLDPDGASAYAEWRRARRAGDGQVLDRARLGVIARLPRIELDTASLSAALRRVSDRMKALSPSLRPADKSAIDSEYLSIRPILSSPTPPAAAATLAARIAALDDLVTRAAWSSTH